jgi:hypothetical protein
MVVETGSLEQERALESPSAATSASGSPSATTPVSEHGPSSATASDVELQQQETEAGLKQYEDEIEPHRLEKPPTPSIQDVGLVADVPEETTDVNLDVDEQEKPSLPSAEKPPTPSVQDMGFVGEVPDETTAQPHVRPLVVDPASGDVGQASLHSSEADDWSSAQEEVVVATAEGDDGGDDIPCVKCSDCAASVPLTELSEHSCAASNSPVRSPSSAGAETFNGPRTPQFVPDPPRLAPADVPQSPDGIASPVTPKASEAVLGDSISRDVPEDVSGEETSYKRSSYISRCVPARFGLLMCLYVLIRVLFVSNAKSQ